MIRNIYVLFKLLGYFITGLLSFFAIMLYLQNLSLYPFRYHFEFYDIYFLITMLVLPFFRIAHPSWFKADDEQFVSYKQKALDLYHQDLAQNHKNRKWSSNSVSVNPWEYTTTTTQTYSNAAGWGYSLAKSLFVSTLFIIFAPLFYGISLLKKCKHK